MEFVFITRQWRNTGGPRQPAKLSMITKFQPSQSSLRTSTHTIDEYHSLNAYASEEAQQFDRLGALDVNKKSRERCVASKKSPNPAKIESIIVFDVLVVS